MISMKKKKFKCHRFFVQIVRGELHRGGRLADQCRPAGRSGQHRWQGLHHSDPFGMQTCYCYICYRYLLYWLHYCICRAEPGKIENTEFRIWIIILTWEDSGHDNYLLDISCKNPVLVKNHRILNRIPEFCKTLIHSVNKIFKKSIESNRSIKSITKKNFIKNSQKNSQIHIMLCHFLVFFQNLPFSSTFLPIYGTFFEILAAFQNFNHFYEKINNPCLEFGRILDFQS